MFGEIMKTNRIQPAYELQMKAILLKHFLDRGIVEYNTTILNEYTFAAFERRIDFALLANEKLIGVEIKSEFDSLVRLSSQLDVYNNYFDKVVIFVAYKHLDKTLELANKREEIYVLKDGKVTQHRKGLLVRPKVKLNYIQMMRKNELVKLCNHFGIKCESESRKLLEESAKNVSLKNLREAAFLSIKKRNKKKNEVFWSHVNIDFNDSHWAHLSDIKQNEVKGKNNSIAKRILKGDWCNSDKNKETTVCT